MLTLCRQHQLARFPIWEFDSQISALLKTKVPAVTSTLRPESTHILNIWHERDLTSTRRITARLRTDHFFVSRAPNSLPATGLRPLDAGPERAAGAHRRGH